MKQIMPTPVGDLVFEIKGAGTEYPGLYISMGNGESVATVEYTPDRDTDGTPGIQVLVWEDAAAEQPSLFANVDNVDAWGK